MQKVRKVMKIQEKIARNGVILISLLIAFVIIGFLLTIELAEDPSFAGIIMIGPLPIIFGTSIETLVNVLVLSIIFLVFYAFLWR